MGRYQKCNIYFSNFPTLLTFQIENIDNPERIANIFNNYFSSINDKTQARIEHSHKNYTDYFSDENADIFFLSPTNKEEIKFIHFSLDINKFSGPYSISSNVLNMLKNDFSEQLADFFNLSFTTGTFPTLLKLLNSSLSIKRILNQFSQIIVQVLFCQTLVRC